MIEKDACSWKQQTCAPLFSISKVMRAQRQKQNDWNRNTDQPEKNGAHYDRLLLSRSSSNNQLMPERFRIESQSNNGAVAAISRFERRPYSAVRSMIDAA